MCDSTWKKHIINQTQCLVTTGCAPLQLGEHWLLSASALQSWEEPLYRLMVINQIEQQAVSWQTLRGMSVSPPAFFPATPYFTSQNYFYFHLSEVLVLWAQGWFWCMQLPEVSDTSLKSHVHTTAEARLQTSQPQIRFWGMQISDELPKQEAGWLWGYISCFPAFLTEDMWMEGRKKV